MRLNDRVVIWFRVARAFVLTFNGSGAPILSAADTVKTLVEGKSLIRFGDGEFGIYEGKSIHYQNWSESLRENFEAIKNEYENNPIDCPYLLAMPQKFMKINGWKLIKKRVYVSSWSQARLYFMRNFRQDIQYGDAFLFEKNNSDIYRKIWIDERCPNNVIFVHNDEKYARRFEETYLKNVFFVQCPKTNAFECVDDLEKRISNVLNNHGWSKDDVMLTISAGPAGKVIVYRLSKQGFQCIDAGHCWDEPLEGI